MIKLADDAIIDVEDAVYVDRYKLRLVFSDGTGRTVDFGPFLERSKNPMIRKYLDLTLFKGFVVEHGDLHWQDYDLCFSIADLYEGHIR